jgi:hypothetical protein
VPFEDLPSIALPKGLQLGLRVPGVIIEKKIHQCTVDSCNEKFSSGKAWADHAAKEHTQHERDSACNEASNPDVSTADSLVDLSLQDPPSAVVPAATKRKPTGANLQELCEKLDQIFGGAVYVDGHGYVFNDVVATALYIQDTYDGSVQRLHPMRVDDAGRQTLHALKAKGAISVVDGVDVVTGRWCALEELGKRFPWMAVAMEAGEAVLSGRLETSRGMQPGTIKCSAVTSGHRKCGRPVAAGFKECSFCRPAMSG